MKQITTKDLEEVLAEANEWAMKFGKTRDLRRREDGGNSVEGAAIADAVLANLLGIDENGLTEWIDQMSAPVLIEMTLRAATRPEGITKWLMSTNGFDLPERAHGGHPARPQVPTGPKALIAVKRSDIKERVATERDVIVGQLFELGADFDKYRAGADDHALAVRCVTQMVDAWDEMQTNMYGSDWETPEEELQFYKRLVATGIAVRDLAELFLEEEV